MTENYLYLERIKQKEELKEKLENKDTINIKNINGKKQNLDIEKRLAIPQYDGSDKVFILEKFTYPFSKNELRFGYYIIGKKGQFEDI